MDISAIPAPHTHPTVECTLGTCLTPLALRGFVTIKLSPDNSYPFHWTSECQRYAFHVF